MNTTANLWPTIIIVIPQSTLGSQDLLWVPMYFPQGHILSMIKDTQSCCFSLVCPKSYLLETLPLPTQTLLLLKLCQNIITKFIMVC